MEETIGNEVSKVVDGVKQVPTKALIIGGIAVVAGIAAAVIIKNKNVLFGNPASVVDIVEEVATGVAIPSQLP